MPDPRVCRQLSADLAAKAQCCAVLCWTCLCRGTANTFPWPGGLFAGRYVTRVVMRETSLDRFMQWRITTAGGESSIRGRFFACSIVVVR